MYKRQDTTKTQQDNHIVCHGEIDGTGNVTVDSKMIGTRAAVSLEDHLNKAIRDLSISVKTCHILIAATSLEACCYDDVADPEHYEKALSLAFRGATPAPILLSRSHMDGLEGVLFAVYDEPLQLTSASMKQLANICILGVAELNLIQNSRNVAGLKELGLKMQFDNWHERWQVPTQSLKEGGLREEARPPQSSYYVLKEFEFRSLLTELAKKYPENTNEIYLDWIISLNTLIKMWNAETVDSQAAIRYVKSLRWSCHGSSSFLREHFENSSDQRLIISFNRAYRQSSELLGAVALKELDTRRGIHTKPQAEYLKAAANPDRLLELD